MGRPRGNDYRFTILRYLYRKRYDPKERIQSHILKNAGLGNNHISGYFALGYILGAKLATETQVGQCLVYTLTDKGERWLCEIERGK